MRYQQLDVKKLTLAFPLCLCVSVVKHLGSLRFPFVDHHHDFQMFAPQQKT